MSTTAPFCAYLISPCRHWSIRRTVRAGLYKSTGLHRPIVSRLNIELVLVKLTRTPYRLHPSRSMRTVGARRPMPQASSEGPRRDIENSRDQTRGSSLLAMFEIRSKYLPLFSADDKQHDSRCLTGPLSYTLRSCQSPRKCYRQGIGRTGRECQSRSRPRIRD